ncbi:hypothetical protein BDQ12DRAFT_322443 [Crucibulum laeve]|uniref:Uncharacterized protein n=1 Tax=Crucibulum laeve TaxID=68775 RepID=A0A5C3LQ68_9AGAR|nr:hypothetical protein BDQ12DRAFT_322443 [Crucibulum laeve]
MSIVRVDDTDSAFVYTGSWQRADGTNEFLGGAHGSRWQGGTADYTFTGTSIAVFGTLGNNSTTDITSTYSIDGTRAGTFVQPHNGSTSYRQQMFRSGQLSSGEHTLHVRLDSQDAWYWLDYVEYIALAATAPSSSGSPTPTVAPAPSSSQNSEP